MFHLFGGLNRSHRGPQLPVCVRSIWDFNRTSNATDNSGIMAANPAALTPNLGKKSSICSPSSLLKTAESLFIILHKPYSREFLRFYTDGSRNVEPLNGTWRSGFELACAAVTGLNILASLFTQLVLSTLTHTWTRP